MNPGKLRHRVTFTGVARTRDEGGGAATAPVDGPSVHACVVPLSAKERANAMAAPQIVTHRVETRFREDLRAYGTIKFDGRVLDVKGAFDPDERQRELHFECEERR